jgi:HEAT repeat protein
MRLHTGLGRKTRSSSRLRLGWLALFPLLLWVYGVLGNWDDAYSVWNRLTAWVLRAVHLRADQVPYPNLLTLVVFLVAVVIGFWIVRYVLTRADRREANASGVSLRALQEKRARNAYLDYLSDDLENRLRSSIHQARFIELGLEETPGATLPWHYVSYPLQGTTTSFSSVDEAFAHFRGRLLLLGAPGSGKTTSLLHIGRRLIAEARRDPQAATPVLLNLSSFEESKPMLSRLTSKPMFSWWKSHPPTDPTLAFDQWLIQELSRLPLPGRDLAQRWVKEGNLALLLDGLDEIREDHRPTVIAAINQSTPLSFPSLPLVVCSRSLDYTRLVDSGSPRLNLQGAVTLQPLARDQIEFYLSAAHASALRDALLADPGLYELAQTPLTLSMMTLAYVGPTPTQAPVSSSLVERQGRLFELYIDRMMQRHARRKVGKPFDLNADLDEPTEYSRNEVDRYLGWLATRMSERARTSFPPGELTSFLGQATQPGATSAFATESPRTVFLSERRLGKLVFALLGTGSMVMAFSTLGARHLSPWVQLASFLGGTIAFLTSELVGRRLINYKAIGALAAFRTFCFSLVTGLVLLSFLWLILFSSVVVLLPTPSTIAAAGVLLAGLYWFRMTGPSAGVGMRASAIVPFAAACLFAVAAHLKGHSDIMWWSLVLAGFLGAVLSVARTFFSVGRGAAGVAALFFASVIATGTIATHAFSKPTLEVSVLATSLSFGVLSAMSAGTALGLAAGAVGGLLVAAAPGAIVGAAFCAKACRGHLRQPLNRWVEQQLSSPCTLAVLACRRQLPVRLTRFLEYASDVLLLQRSGGDFEFVHRLLRDHFALRSLTPLIFGGNDRNRVAVVANIALLGDAGFAALSELATHPDPSIREAAAVGLGDLRLAEAAPLLRRLLSSESLASIRCRIVESLGKTPLEEGREAWDLSFGDSSSDVRSAAAKALGRMEPAELVKQRHLLELLQGALRDSSEQVVRASIQALGNEKLIPAAMAPSDDQIQEALASGGLNILELFDAPARVLGLRTDKDRREHSGRIRDQARKLLRGNDAKERSSAARVLGILKDNDSLETLLAATRDDEVDVRQAAVFALGDLASVEAVPRLIEILQQNAAKVRAAAAESLGKVLASEARACELSEEARDAIEETLIHSLLVPGHRVWLPAIKALKETPSRRTASALLRSLKSLSKEHQDAAMDSLSEMGPFIDSEDLLSLLGAQRLRIKYGAARLLAHHPSTETLLLSWLEHGEPHLQVGAAFSLGAMRSANAIPGLVSILREFGCYAPDALFGYFRREDMAPDEAASYALVLIGNPAVPQLAELLREGGAVSLGLVAEILAGIATPSAERELRRFRGSTAASRATIREAFGTLKKQRKLLHRGRGESPGTIWVEMIMDLRLARIADD